MSDPNASPHWRFSMRTVLELMVAFGTVCALIYYLSFAVDGARHAARRMQESNNLNNVAIALRNYCEQNKELPPAIVFDKEGKPFKSWRVMLVPFLEATPLHSTYKHNEPWNSPSNDAECRPYHFGIFNAPGTANADPACTNVARPVGPGTVGEEAINLDAITDGLNNTILVISLKPSDILWHEPRDLHLSEITRAPGNPKRIMIRGKLFQGSLCGMADGSVVDLPADLDYDTFLAMLTYACGEDIDMSRFETLREGFADPTLSTTEP